jgi:hypothetical protein
VRGRIGAAPGHPLDADGALPKKVPSAHESGHPRRHRPSAGPPDRPARMHVMGDRDRELAKQLERLRRTLLALEAYMSQVRDLMGHTQALIDGRDPGPQAPRPRRRAARPK